MLHCSGRKSNSRVEMTSNRYSRASRRGLMLLALASFWGVAGSTEIQSPVTGSSSSVHALTPNQHFQAIAAAPTARILNPHLHITHTAAATSEPMGTPDFTATPEHHTTRLHELIVAHTHHGWHHWWGYHTWVASRRGVGTVEGYVRDGHGRPMRMALVVLKTPKGASFKNVAKRHTTHTNAYGAFVMRGVRAGNYRVVAHSAKKHGHVLTAVRTGNMSAVAIRI